MSNYYPSLVYLLLGANYLTYAMMTPLPPRNHTVYYMHLPTRKGTGGPTRRRSLNATEHAFLPRITFNNYLQCYCSGSFPYTFSHPGRGGEWGPAMCVGGHCRLGVLGRWKTLGFLHLMVTSISWRHIIIYLVFANMGNKIYCIWW